MFLLIRYCREYGDEALDIYAMSDDKNDMIKELKRRGDMFINGNYPEYSTKINEEQHQQYMNGIGEIYDLQIIEI